MTKIELQLNKDSMLSGPLLTFYPLAAMILGGIAEAIVFNQLAFLANHKFDGFRAIRISYSKLQQRHFPFFSRRWVIEIIGRLEYFGFISVSRTGRVNLIEINFSNPNEGVTPTEDLLPDIFDSGIDWKETKSSIAARMQVSPELASRIGLLEAIAIQQIHIRHRQSDGSCWVIRSHVEWRENVFMFIGIATVKRLFSRLEKQNLIFMKKHISEDGVVNCYRVNYERIAEVLEIELPKSVNPIHLEDAGWIANEEKWVDQIKPVKAQKKNTATVESTIH